MRFSKKIIMLSPLILVGCLTSEDKQIDISRYTQTVNNQLQQRRQDELNRQAREASRQADEKARCRERASAEETRQIKEETRQIAEEARQIKEEARQIREAEENSLRTFKEEEARRQKPVSKAPVIVGSSVGVSQPAEWQPLDGQVVRAGELVMELKRNKGGANPSHAEMVAYLQSQMSLTSSQAEKVLDELGL